ncbi:MAG: hypothetical protein KBF40_09555 [Giesbergeria sp.]|nr:hypothetical protein [Simplicispira sp.]MBP6158928.1 hypothetical protein [Giesbergeria sp.]MBP7083598.1 hypothetical protein [Giesbergeria sp.]MBP9895575.1 hypothetical protein [Giesbergeria sp.]
MFQPEALLAVGSVRLAIYAVIGIAGRAHCGLAIDECAWSQWGVGLIVAAALLPAGAAWAASRGVAGQARAR